MDECHPTSHGFWEVVVRICRLGRDCVKASASGRRRAVRAHFALAAGLFLSLTIFLVPGASAQRSQLRPGWNAFTPQEDISLGKRAAADAEKQLALCNAPRVDAYLTQLGTRLAQKLPTGGVQYPFEFHCVNDKAINAFALPGGYVFVNRGAIEAADNEAQLAAVMAHELSHVALRHGTNQATKAVLAQTGLGIFGAVFGDSTGGALLTTLGSFTAGGVLLRYSRTAESQADVMGTQVLYDAGYDPRAMAQFFEKLEAEMKGKNPPEFFSDHPNPEHRVERVDEEIDKLGGVPPNAKRDSQEFEAIKREVLADGSGHSALAYGLIVGVAQAKGDPNDSNALDAAARQVIQGLQQANPNMKVARQSERVRLNGQPGLSTYLTNDSPAGGQETDWVITVLRSEGTVYFVCVAPQSAYSNYDKAFSAILDSVRFTK